MPPTPPKPSTVAPGEETTSPQASTTTPAGGISEAHFEHSGDHRASLGGLGADSNWADLPAGGAGNISRCVSLFDTGIRSIGILVCTNHPIAAASACQC